MIVYDLSIRQKLVCVSPCIDYAFTWLGPTDESNQRSRRSTLKLSGSRIMVGPRSVDARSWPLKK